MTITVREQAAHRLDLNNDGKVSFNELTPDARANIDYVRSVFPKEFEGIDSFEGDAIAWVKKTQPVAYAARENSDAGTSRKLGGTGLIVLGGGGATVGAIAVMAVLFAANPVLAVGLAIGLAILALGCAIGGGVLIGSGYGKDDDETIKMIEKAAQDAATKAREAFDRDTESNAMKAAIEERDAKLAAAKEEQTNEAIAHQQDVERVFQESTCTPETMSFRNRDFPVVLHVDVTYKKSTVKWDEEDRQKLGDKLSKAGVPEAKIQQVLDIGSAFLTSVVTEEPSDAEAQKELITKALTSIRPEQQLLFAAVTQNLTDDQLWQIVELVAPLPADATREQWQKRNAAREELAEALFPIAKPQGGRPAAGPIGALRAPVAPSATTRTH